jgi:hypothetical protein
MIQASVTGIPPEVEEQPLTEQENWEPYHADGVK